ncbi:MAG: hypothetical protein ACRBBW_00375 [Cellvibrionaceae bacterium]
MRLVAPLFSTNMITGLCFLAISLSCAAQSKDPETLSVALHPPPYIQTLSVNEARAIFSMRTRVWPDGSPITVFVLPNSSPRHSQFVRSLLTLLPHQLQRNWDRLVYTGIGQAPIEVANETAMIEQLKSTPGSIGYVDIGTKDETLHLIKLR